MKTLSCFCDNECQHFNLGLMEFKEKPKLNVEDIYTDSDSEHQYKPEFDQQDNTISDTILETDMSQIIDKSTNDFNNIVRPSSINQYKIDDYVLVKFPIRSTEYRYVAIINQTIKKKN
ncbi:unnamed protein product [Psylliodes chrysocephalus]|uniref:Uncharacterized protein n=1 Tax=Psylliodes chrysocephalus TaxID=3402493 RepID=A0A9P0GKR7_9CUCU|nr:unnamed protein product [Psylliodes chrysocephala]